MKGSVDMAKRYKTATKIECDEPMARHMGLLPCDHKCVHCFACIITLVSGEREHIDKTEDWGIRLKRRGING